MCTLFYARALSPPEAALLRLGIGRRSDLRVSGEALGLTEDLIKTLSSQVWGWSDEGVEPKHVEDLNLNLSDRRLRLALDLARELMGAPRHLFCRYLSTVFVCPFSTMSITSSLVGSSPSLAPVSHRLQHEVS